MNNKRLGTAFEREMCERLAQAGYWVHFIVPDARGAQPFDIIAVKVGKAFAIDCKTCVADSFSISRLEENQKFAFNKWIACGNEEPIIAVKHKDHIFVIRYTELCDKKTIKLKEEYLWNGR